LTVAPREPHRFIVEESRRYDLISGTAASPSTTRNSAALTARSSRPLRALVRTLARQAARELFARELAAQRSDRVEDAHVHGLHVQIDPAIVTMARDGPQFQAALQREILKTRAIGALLPRKNSGGSALADGNRARLSFIRSAPADSWSVQSVIPTPSAHSVA
jgi:hypothetical protein